MFYCILPAFVFALTQVVVVGAHLDSWDVGQGAHDDGQGCMIAWEVIRLLKQLGMRALAPCLDHLSDQM